MKMLARREHSALEITQKLKAKGFDVNEVEQVIDYLVQQNYQSDERFANEFMQMRFNQGKGSQLIIQQLKQKGIELFDLSEYDFFALAKQVRIKKYGDALPTTPKEKAKQMRFLQSRGFSFDEIKFSMEAL